MNGSLRRAGAVLLAAVLLQVVPGPGARYASADDEGLDAASDVGAIAVPLAAGLYAWSRGDRDGMKDLALIWGSAVGTSSVLKLAVDADRPNGKPESFPSRHAASAFAGASFLQQRYGWKAAAPAYVLALGTGYARVENDDHYWRDVIASAAIAHLSAFLLTDRFDDEVTLSVACSARQTSCELRGRITF